MRLSRHRGPRACVCHASPPRACVQQLVLGPLSGVLQLNAIPAKFREWLGPEADALHRRRTANLDPSGEAAPANDASSEAGAAEGSAARDPDGASSHAESAATAAADADGDTDWESVDGDQAALSDAEQEAHGQAAGGEGGEEAVDTGPAWWEEAGEFEFLGVKFRCAQPR